MCDAFIFYYNVFLLFYLFVIILMHFDVKLKDKGNSLTTKEGKTFGAGICKYIQLSSHYTIYMTWM